MTGAFHAFENPAMKRDHKGSSGEVRKFKGTTILDWESEPSVMRPTGFEHSTVPSSLWEQSRFESSTLGSTRTRQQRRGPSTVVWSLIIAVAVTTAVLFGIARFLKTRQHGESIVPTGAAASSDG